MVPLDVVPEKVKLYGSSALEAVSPGIARLAMTTATRRTYRMRATSRRPPAETFLIRILPPLTGFILVQSRALEHG
jgi:hypothetical protein